MDQFWQTDELVRIVCDFLPVKGHFLNKWQWRSADIKALVALACTCKSINEIALDFLWGIIHIDSLYALFPAQNIGYIPADLLPGDEILHPEELYTLAPIFIRPPLTTQQWSRFHAHAHRVKVLRISSPRMPRHQSILPAIAQYCKQRPPFPNLRTLIWDGTVEYMAPISIFFSSTLCNLTLDLGSRLHTRFHTDSGPDHDCFLDVFQCLQDAKIQLRHLDLTWELSRDPANPKSRYRTISPSIHASISAVLSRFLVHIKVVPSTKLFYDLAHLPFLQSLALCRWDERLPPDPAYTQWLDSESLFPALLTLDVEADHLSGLTRLISGAHCFPKAEIQVECWDYCTGEHFAAFLQAVLHPVHSRGLRQFRFGMSYFDDWGTYNFSQPAMEILRPVLSLKHLEVFSMHPTGCFDINDANLKQLVLAWPNLKSLTLGTLYPSQEHFNEAKPQITLDGLENLVGLPKLRELSITISPTTTNNKPLTYVSPSLLTSITFGPAIFNGTAARVGHWLLQRFPCLREIHTESTVEAYEYSDGSLKKWAKLQRMLTR